MCDRIAGARPPAGGDGRSARRRSTSTPTRFWDALAEDFNTPRAWAALSAWIRSREPACSTAVRRSARAICARCSGPSASRTCWRRAPTTAPRRRRRRSLEERQAAKDAQGLRRARTRSATSSPPRAGRSATRAEGAAARTAQAVIVYGRNAVREALRGRRKVSRVWADTSAAREPWLRGVQLEERRRRTSSSRSAGRRTTRASAPTPATTPTPTRTALLADDDALVVVLDEIQDPRNLGAVCRVAETAGRRGPRDPRAPRGPGDAGRLQDVGRRRRAPARRPRAQHRRLPGHRARRRRLDLRRRRRRRSLRPAGLLRAQGPGARSRRAEGCARGWRTRATS